MGGVRLRQARPDDIEARMRLGFSAEIHLMYGYVSRSQAETTREQAEGWYQSLAEHPCAWVIEADGELAGQVRLDSVNETDRRARLAIGLLHERFLGRGIGRKAILQVLAHGFDLLGLHRIDLRVLSYNARAIACYQACGFRHEGTERQSARVGEVWQDDWIMAILEPEYRATQARQA